MVEDVADIPLRATGFINVTVLDNNEAPVIQNPGQTFTIPEMSPPGTVIATMTATDPDVGDTQSWSIAPQNPAALGSLAFPFQINAATGVITVRGAINNGLDFEQIPSYAVLVTVRDCCQRGGQGPGQLNDTQLFTIQLEDVNEAPSAWPGQVTVPESVSTGVVILTINASDPDTPSSPFGTLRYDIMAGDPDFMFNISTSGGLYFSQRPDFEDVTSYVLSVRVRDTGSPALEASTTVIVNITNVNDVVITSVWSDPPEHSTLGGQTVVF